MDTRHIMARTRRREVLNIERLRKRYVSILKEIEPKEITPYMFEMGGITFKEMKEINEKEERNERARVLLNMIFERGVEHVPFDRVFVYGAFLSSLKSCGYNTLVDTIQHTYIDEDFDLGLGEHKIITGRVLQNKELESKREVMYRFLEFGHRRCGVIEVTAFDLEAMELAESLIVGKTYTITDVFVKEIPEDYKSIDSIGVDFEVVLTKSSYIISNENLSEDNYDHVIDYATIPEIKQMTDRSIVNIIARVKALESPFCTPEQDLICQEIYLSDSNSEQLKMTVFKNNINKFKVGQKIKIYKAKMEKFHGEVSLNTSSKTDISVLNSPVSEDVRIPVLETDSDDVVRYQAVICSVQNDCRRRPFCKTHGYCDCLDELPNGKYICTECKELCPNGFSIVLKLRESSSGETFEAVGFNKLGKKLFNTNYEAFTMCEPWKQQLLLESVVGDEYIFSYKNKIKKGGY
ncbi:uncharacterized protein LOC121387980 [Gigantopelta aegis]|uniref:uncharacterized protein LOC121387980 n=1 Tax=Gigantopelta aegis TaxID=1735272 RepID=UPI001B888596|nr:uncharacterized protein LOC121387980 [Gigantopelta aegis]